MVLHTSFVSWLYDSAATSESFGSSFASSSKDLKTSQKEPLALPGKSMSPSMTWPPKVALKTLKVASVTMPKLNPAPRMAQNKSGFCVLEVVTRLPLAMTIFADSSASSIKPR